MSEKLDYLLTALDYYISSGEDPGRAWSIAVEDYAIVYHCDDGRPEIARAAEIVLDYMNGKESQMAEGKERPQSQIEHEGSELERLLEDLHDTIGRLEERLSPITTPAAAPESKWGEPDGLVPHATFLNKMCRRISDANERIRSIIQRLEL